MTYVYVIGFLPIPFRLCTFTSSERNPCQLESNLLRTELELILIGSEWISNGIGSKTTAGGHVAQFSASYHSESAVVSLKLSGEKSTLSLKIAALCL